MAKIRRSPVEAGSFSHHLQGFIHPRWCRISSININKSIQIQQNNLLQQNNLKFHHKKHLHVKF